MESYGYIRVSSRDQNTDRQMDALLKRGIKKRNIYADYVSGKDFERPEYKKLMRIIKAGDLVVVKSIDRLGRNYIEILDQWRGITKEKGANIEVLDMSLLNTATVQNGLTGVFISDLVLQILAYVAETERELIHQRQKEGIEAAKKRGIKFGRSKLEVPEKFDDICGMYYRGEITTRSAAKLVGLSATTFYRRYHEQLALHSADARFKW